MCVPVFGGSDKDRETAVIGVSTGHRKMSRHSYVVISSWRIKLFFGQTDGGFGFSDHENLQDRLFWTKNNNLMRQDDMVRYQAI